jgi:CRISPR-associated endonuclease Cas2
VQYIVAYDIADPRRLRRVARFMERRAVRCQKSVFLFRGDDAAVAQMLDEVSPLLKLSEDCVQAWRLSPNQPATGRMRGTVANIHPGGAVLFDGRPLLLDAPDHHPGT